GPAQAVDFLLSFIPPEVAFCLGRPFIRRLIDAGDFDALEEVTRLGSRNQYLMIASAYELLDVGRFPTAESMQDCLVLLTMRRVRIEKPRYSYDNTVDSAILAFVEACAARKLPKTQ